MMDIVDLIPQVNFQMSASLFMDNKMRSIEPKLWHLPFDCSSLSCLLMCLCACSWRHFTSVHRSKSLCMENSFERRVEATCCAINWVMDAQCINRSRVSYQRSWIRWWYSPFCWYFADKIMLMQIMLKGASINAARIGLVNKKY